MLIRAQMDRKTVECAIVNALDVSIAPSGRKGFYLFGRLAGATLFTGSRRCVAIYETKEAAIAEIDAMVSYFESNPHGIYKMR